MIENGGSEVNWDSDQRHKEEVLEKHTLIQEQVGQWTIKKVYQPPLQNSWKTVRLIEAQVTTLQMSGYRGTITVPVLVQS